MELITYTLYMIEHSKKLPLSYDNVVKQIQEFFSRAETCKDGNGFSDEEWNAGLFAVCAWIDESILCSDWPEKEKWEQSLLQRVHFNTTKAGEEFFVKLAGFDNEARSVREVYAYCLALGFKGRYFSKRDEDKLNAIREANLNLVIKDACSETSETLFPGAYSGKTTSSGGKKWIRLISPAWLPFFLFPVLVFAALYFFYKYILENMVLNYFGSAF